MVKSSFDSSFYYFGDGIMSGTFKESLFLLLVLFGFEECIAKRVLINIYIGETQLSVL